MSTVLALQQCGERGVREVVLHLKHVDKLRHASTLLNDVLQVFVRVFDEFLD